MVCFQFSSPTPPVAIVGSGWGTEKAAQQSLIAFILGNQQTAEENRPRISSTHFRLTEKTVDFLWKIRRARERWAEGTDVTSDSLLGRGLSISSLRWEFWQLVITGWWAGVRGTVMQWSLFSVLSGKPWDLPGPVHVPCPWDLMISSDTGSLCDPRCSSNRSLRCTAIKNTGNYEQFPDGVGGLSPSFEEEKSVAKGKGKKHSNSGIIECELQWRGKKKVSIFPLKAIAKCYPQDKVNENVSGSGKFDHKPLKAPLTLTFLNDFSKTLPVYQQARRELIASLMTEWQELNSCSRQPSWVLVTECVQTEPHTRLHTPRDTMKLQI